MFRRHRKLDDFTAEIDSHLEHEIARLLEQGMTQDEARTIARRQFGNVTRARERFYESHRWLWLDHLAQDVSYGLRMLRKSPGFTVVAVLTLALGIGANTAIFSVVNAVLLRPLPYKGANRIVYLSGMALETGNLPDWEQQSKSYDLFAAVSLGMAELTGIDEGQRLWTSEVSQDYFSLWGIQPELGRELVQADFQSGSPRVALISDHLWRNSLNTDGGVIGRSIVLNHLPYTVIGVMPPAIGPFPYRNIDVWMPLLPGRSKGTAVLARLKPGVSFETARAEALANADHLASKQARDSRDTLLSVWLLRDQLVEDSRLTLLLLSGVVGFVLLIVCANVANLLLAGLSGRRREVAVRIALGAGRARIVRQLLVEGLLLSAAGAVLGLLTAHWAAKVLVSNVPYYVPRIDQSRIDAATFAFTLLVSSIAALVFSLPPALAMSAPDLNTTLKEGARNQSAAPGHRGLRAAFIVSELALVTVVLAGTGLLIKAFIVLRPTNPGFDSASKLTMTVISPYQATDFFRTATERIESLPGVSGVALVSYLPMAGVGFIPDILIDGKLVAGIGEDTRAFYRACSANYLSLMRMPIVSGRDFSENDNERAPKVAIVSETMAHRLWPNLNPVGRRVTIKWADQPVEFTVVGIVRDHRHIDTSTSPRAEIYVPFWQDPAGTMSLVILARNNPASLVPAVRAALDGLDRDTVISDIQTMQDILDHAVAPPRYNAELFGVFGGLALMLAIVGIYGVVSHAVSQRTHEIGVRMALGAQPKDVTRMIIGEGVALALFGIAIGTVAALALSRFVEHLLYEVKPTDPVTFAGVAALLVAVALLACYVPARRAMRVDPVVALRHE